MSYSVKIYDTCIGCTQCVRACPTDVLEMIHWDRCKAKQIASAPRTEDCVGCKRCESAPMTEDCVDCKRCEYVTMSNIIRGLSRISSSRSLRSHDSSASALNNSAYDLERSSYKIIRFTASSLAASSSASFYSHHIKFNISKLNEEMSQIENQLKNMFLFLKKSLSQLFFLIMNPL